MEESKKFEFQLSMQQQLFLDKQIKKNFASDIAKIHFENLPEAFKEEFMSLVPEIVKSIVFNNANPVYAKFFVDSVIREELKKLYLQVREETITEEIINALCDPETVLTDKDPLKVLPNDYSSI